jgi:anti-sigma B factor antagonist
MDTKITIRKRRNAVVIEVIGKLTLGAGTQKIRKNIQELVAAGHRRIVLNLEGVTNADSSAIGELVVAYILATAHGGEMKLLKTSRPVREVLIIAKLETVFESYEDEGAALRSFRIASQLPAPQEQHSEMFYG